MRYFIRIILIYKQRGPDKIEEKRDFLFLGF